MLRFNGFVIFAVVTMITVPAQAVFITGVSATASDTETAGADFIADNIVNGNGFNAIAGTHSEIYNSDGIVNWRTGDLGSAAAVSGAWVQFDLGAVYNLGSMQIWNMNRIDPDLTEHGIEQMDVLVSLDDTIYTTALTDVMLTEAPGLSTYTGETVALSAMGVRFVRFEVDSAFGAPATFQAGLSEVRFTEAINPNLVVPEPSTFLLLGLGALGLMRHTRRRRRRA